MYSFVDQNRAVNPIIGTVMLIGIAVILSAAIGTFLIGVGSDLSGGVQAGVQVSNVVQDDDEGFVTVTGISMQRADAIDVEATVTTTGAIEDDSGDPTSKVTRSITSVDESVTFRQHSSYTGDVEIEIIAIAHRDDTNDDSSLILSEEYTI